jgi:hypothetical protein
MLLARHVFRRKAAISNRGELLHTGWLFSQPVELQQTLPSGRFHYSMVSRTISSGFASLIDHCLLPQAGGHSLSDFPLADLDQDSFDQIAGLLND